MPRRDGSDGTEPRFTSVDLRLLLIPYALLAGFVFPAQLHLRGGIRVLALSVFVFLSVVVIVGALIYVFKRDV